MHLVRQNHHTSLQAREAYAAFLDRLRQQYQPERIQDGVFGAMMQVGSEMHGWQGTVMSWVVVCSPPPPPHW